MENVGNYGPMSIFLFFNSFKASYYNCICNLITVKNLLYKKQFGLQSRHSTDHAINQLADYLLQSFENNYVTLGIFIDLSKAFDKSIVQYY